MSDGWQVYRYYRKRLRCWAHLIRKAEGLKDSLDKTSCLFGEQTLLLLKTLIKAVYAARERPPDQALPITYQGALSDYRCACEATPASPAGNPCAFLLSVHAGLWYCAAEPVN